MGYQEGSFLHRADARSLAVSGAIWLIGPGLGVVPRAMEDVRDLAASQRELALRWSGVGDPRPARPAVPAIGSLSEREVLDGPAAGAG
ncbi:hypothetical protein ACFW6M_10315 [Streptomyces nigra]|uniref:hypothetical protein n=1 Tax=Streptomyces nigra TaxID=1827580 RepID=UPI0036ABCA2B